MQQLEHVRKFHVGMVERKVILNIRGPNTAWILPFNNFGSPYISCQGANFKV